ncbi:MAG: DEAD/DEAH box helicase family protein, partial [Chryseobacterium sp.]|nr:DEAD/DEAH box helicase family protein [Chryseobacterium sp.]
MNREQVTLNHTPIQYKELSHSDFEGYTFEDNNVTEIVSDSNGYISDFILQNIQLDKKDTTVINASVGQGKTTAIISIAKEYYKKRDEGYIVFLIAPFKSLLDQYKNSLQKLEI